MKTACIAFGCLFTAPVMAQGNVAAPAAPTIAAHVGAEQSATSGGGLVVRVKGRCIVVTALHVVEGKEGIRISTSGQENWAGDLAGRSEGADIATIVSDTPGRRCADMPAADALAKAVQATEGKLLIAAKDGEVLPMPVTVIRVGGDIIRIASRIPGVDITQGMSGSPLLMNDIPVAILTGVAADESGRPGLAIRLDQAARMLGPANLPILEVTVIASSAPVLQTLGDSVARADAAALRRYKGSDIGAADVAAALRQPSDTQFIADRLFESIRAEPKRVDALAALLDLGLAPDLVVPARDPGDTPGPVYDKSLFWHAVDAGAVDAAVLLLKRGASPHGYRAPDRASTSNRMIFPTTYIFEKVSEPDERRRLYDAMIEAGLVLPIGPRRFVKRKGGKECAYINDPCPAEIQGEWRDTYDIWAGDDEDAAPFREVSAIRAGAVRRNFSGSMSCLASQARRTSVPAGWEATLDKLPSHFDYVEQPGYTPEHDFSVEGFIGVFKDRAWFITRRRGSVGWVDDGDNFSLMSVSRDLTRIDVYTDRNLCEQRSCLRAEKVDVTYDKGMMVIVDGRHRWNGTRPCRRTFF